MTSVTRVPDVRGVPGRELGATEVWSLLRRRGWVVCRQALARFRYGDGFSHSRALGFQLSLAFVPLVIALIGLSGALGSGELGAVLRSTVLALTPTASDELVRETLQTNAEGDPGGSQRALWIGLAAAVAALTTAMGQVERGANRIYGIVRDRPTLPKYGRALVMALGAGVPALAGSGVLVAGSAFGAAIEDVYGVDDDLVEALALPVGAVLLLVSITAILRHSPRRRQPGWSWLALGAVVTLGLWLAFTALLAGYVELSRAFGVVYGPLTGVIALLVWAQLTSMAVFAGIALAAQTEAEHAGVSLGAHVDTEAPDGDSGGSVPHGDAPDGDGAGSAEGPVGSTDT